MVDDLPEHLEAERYDNTGEWFVALREAGYTVLSSVPWKVGQVMREHDLSLGEAVDALVEVGALVVDGMSVTVAIDGPERVARTRGAPA